MGAKHSKTDIRREYEYREKLGSGSFAIVKRAVRKKDKLSFAVKIIDKQKLNGEEVKAIHDEVKMLSFCDHPNCVQLVEIFDTKTELCLVMELLSGGELFDRIIEQGSFSERQAADVVRQVVSALKHLHNQGVIHRDLKPENLLFDKDETIKITDFGLAKQRQPDTEGLSTACGTPGYVAPEVLARKPYGQEVDMWSLGVIVYIMLCGYPPFFHNNTAGLYKQIRKGEYDFQETHWTLISDSAKRLVKGLLTVEPMKRLTPDEVLAHEWLDGTAPTDSFNEDYSLRLWTLRSRQKLRNVINIVSGVRRVADLLLENNTHTEAQSPRKESVSEDEEEDEDVVLYKYDTLSNLEETE